MTHRLARPVLAAAAILLATLTSGPTGPAHAAPPPAPTISTVGAGAVAALVDALGSTVATTDDSRATDCMSATAPVAVPAAARAAAGRDRGGSDGGSDVPVVGAPVEPVAYRTDRIAVRTAMEPATLTTRARTALDLLGSDAAVTGVESVEFPPPDDDGPPITPVRYVSFAAPVPVVALARLLRLDPFNPVAASPVYLFGPSDGPSEMWPNGPPLPTTIVAAARAAGTGAGVTVAVYDTGLPTPAQGNWPPNVSRLSGLDAENIDVREPLGVADQTWAGHTLAIADVLATLAPAVDVEAVRITEPGGVATDESTARRMATTLRAANAAAAWPDLIIVASGTAACEVDPTRPWLGDMPPLGLQLVTEAIERHDRAMFLVSAGNRSTSRPYYPAAFAQPSVIAVGALDTGKSVNGDAWTSPSRSGPRAWYSNHGRWVDAWASGTDLATRHVRGVSFYPDGPVIYGQALVAGTSFTPSYVASMIAERMAATGKRAEAAWQEVRASGTPCSAAVGGGVAVTLTSLGATATTRARVGTSPEC